VTTSLRVRLAVTVGTVLAAVLAAFAVVVHAVLGQALARQLDLRLAGNAAAVAGMAEDDASGPEFEEEVLPEFVRPTRPGYYEAWLEDGSVLARSPSLAGRDLPRLPVGVEPTFTELALPDARPGRAVALRQPLRIEDAGGGARASKRLVTVVVAQGTEEGDETLATMRRWLWALALAAFGAAIAGVVLIVSLALRPTAALAARLGGLGAGELDRPLPAEGLPSEIRPLIGKLNELLARLGASFARERRFTADVSHELRTPLAALRTTLEVAASRDRAAPDYRAAIEEALALVRQTDSLVANLLLLARLDARQIAVEIQDVPLPSFVDDSWRVFATQAAKRGLAFSNEVAAETVVRTDPDKLRIVLANLLSNATAYTASGGAIVVRDGPANTLFEVHDSGPPLPAELIPRLFERFSRGDPSRSGGEHCGVGLAVVSSMCEVLGLRVSGENQPDGSVCFRVRRGKGSGGAEGGEGRAGLAPDGPLAQVPASGVDERVERGATGQHEAHGARRRPLAERGH
jgi:two-component system sensor histidine kinase QseC